MVTIFHFAQLLLGSFERKVEKLGLVVQLVRIPACHAGGREFESRPDRKIAKSLSEMKGFFIVTYTPNF